MEKSLFIYLDEGVDSRSFRHCLRRVKGRGYRVASINASTLIQGGWEEKAALLLFPGGRDIPYDRALRGEGNRRIRAFVEGGGAYLGICAGAYYGAQEVEFEKGGALEVCERRELAFFPQKALGPAFEKGRFSYTSSAGARICQVRMKEELFSAYFNGGCYFEKAKGIENIAFYEDFASHPAIVFCKVGKGRAILTGVHAEYPESDPRLFQELFSRLC